jgi:predicted acyltransferase
MAYAFARYEGGEPRTWRLYARIAQRVVVLVALGLVLSGWGKVPFAGLHLMGVLQRVALTYLLAALVILHVPRRAQWVLGAAVLLGYWALLVLVPVPGHGAGVLTPAGNLSGWVDRLVLTRPHIYGDGLVDPEGVLTTLPAVVTVLAGYWAARWLRARPVTCATSVALARAGALLTAVGGLWHLALPVNKWLWSSSYVALTAGLSLLLLAGAYHLIEVRGHRRLGRPLAVLGLNAIVLYVGSEQLAGWLKSVGFRSWAYDRLFAPTFGLDLGSTVYALAYAAFWWIVLYAMFRRRWFVTV